MDNTIDLNIEFLVQGLYPIEKFEIDGFKLYTNIIDEQLINHIGSKSYFYFPREILRATFQEKDNIAHYLTLKNKKYILKLEKNLNEHDEFMIETIIGEELDKVLKKLQRSLQLKTNFNIVLPRGIVKTTFLNKEIKFGISGIHESSLQIHQYTESQKKLLLNRLSKGFSLDSLEEYSVKNEAFGRALEFYFDSFLVEDLRVKFTLLIVSLEALFNQGEKGIRKTISKYGSEILFVSQNEEEEFYKLLFAYYGKRNFFIHGNNPIKIHNSDEYKLREIVRKILLVYWMIMVTEKIESPKDIKKYLDENQKRDELNIKLQSFIISLENENYEEIKLNVIKNIIENMSRFKKE